MGLAYLQLKHLGYEDVRIYLGGWSHWGNELTLPVLEGYEPYDGDFALDESRRQPFGSPYIRKRRYNGRHDRCRPGTPLGATISTPTTRA
jgi:hypothetical protein